MRFETHTSGSTDKLKSSSKSWFDHLAGVDASFGFSEIEKCI